MPMDLLLPENITIVEKDRLFYDKWDYCVVFSPVKECSLLIRLNHTAIDRGVVWRNSHRTKFNQISQDDVKKLHDICDVLLNTTIVYKQRREWSKLFLYTNDLRLAQEILNHTTIESCEIKQAVITKPRDVLIRLNPAHKYRTYFRSRRYTLEQKNTLVNFYKNNKNDVVFSEAFRSWLVDITHSYRGEWSQSYYYIDHDSTSWLSMLNMLLPGSTSKTLSIQTAK
jgi:hypothetical protein